ncbi:MAG: amino acid adenylation domain-containing protein [Acidobacteriota bacterium]
MRWSSLVDLLTERARELPEQRAYTFLDDAGEAEATLTFGDLDRRARAIASALQAAGLGGQRAMLLYAPGIEFVAAFFGCLYAGVVAVPGYPPRSRRSLPRLMTVAQDARAAVALTTAGLKAKFTALAGDLPDLAAIHWLATDEVPLAAAESWRQPSVEASTLAFLQYTSGSTSAPKGVMVSHGNLLHNEELIRRAFDQSRESVICGWLPLYHDMGLIGNVLQPLYVGAPCYLLSPFAFLQRPRLWLEVIGRYGATTSGGPNFAYDLCVRKIPPAERAGLDLTSWRVAFNGAEPVRAGTLERFATAFADCGFDRRAFLPCYGLAEGTLFVTGEPVAEAPRVRPFEAEALEQGQAIEAPGGRDLVASGVVAGDQRIAIVDPATGQPRAAGEVGEIWLAGPSVTGGYWRRPEATAECFGARLAGEPEASYLRTGDLGFSDGERLFVTGRLKDLIILRGRNHYPQDIELTVEGSHRALRPGCGAAVAHTVEGEERLVVLQEVERSARQVEPAEVFAAVRRAVVEVHQVEPALVVLLKAGSIPKTSSGKVQRRLSRRRWLKGEVEVLASWPAAAGAEEPAPRAARRRAVIAGLTTLAARLLKVAEEEIRPDTPLPLDSLAALELRGEVEASLGVALPLEELFESPSLERLAELIAATPAKEPAAVEEPAVQDKIAGEPAPAWPEEMDLSLGQRALWFLEKVDPGRDAYHIAFAGEVAAGVSRDALADAWQRLTQRHRLLRAGVVEVEGEPRLRVAAAPGELETASFAGDGRDLDGELQRQARRPFDLASGDRLARCRWIDRPGEPPILLFVFHHLVADLGSLAIVAAELARLLAEPAAELAPLTGDYSELVAAQQPDPELGRFWHDELDPLPAALELPLDRSRPPVQRFTAGVERFRVPGDELAAWCRRQGVTPFVALLAAYQAFLGRLSGQRVFCVGAPAAGRDRASRRLVGYYVNPLTLRADLTGEPSFERLAADLKERVRRAVEHQAYPFPRLVEELHPERDASRSPLFQAFFSYARGRTGGGDLGAFALGEAGATLELGPLRFERRALDPQAAAFDLSLAMATRGSELVGSFTYARELFDQATVERWTASFGRFLGELVARPKEPFGRLPLLSSEERRQILVDWNDTLREDSGETFLELFAARVAAHPGQAAVSSGDEVLSYGDLDRASQRLAERLRGRGIGPGDRVGVAVARSPRLLVALLGVLRAGAAYVPLDLAFPAQRLSYMIEDAGLRLVLSEAARADDLPPHRVPVLDLAEAASGDPVADAPRPRPLAGEDTAYVIYTSGSTGRPKGVVVPHRALRNFLLAMAEEPGLAAGQCLLAVTSLSFDISALELYLPLIVGGRVEVAGRDETSDGEALARRLDTCRADAMQATPATWRMLLEAGWRGRPQLAMLCGGEALPGDLAAELLPRGRALWNLYGPTETAVWSACQPVSGEIAGEGSVALGRAIRNTRLLVLDGHGEPLPIGVAGELLIGGRGLADGYLQRPALTAERFVPDPLAGQPGGGAPGARLYRTGDLVRWRSAGVLEFLGRLDHQVKVRGHRIELGEVESVLSAVPGVTQAVAVARRDGGGEAELVAYVTAEESFDVDLLRGLARRSLPEYMVPSRLVRLESFPLTPNGKVDRRALPAPQAARPKVAPQLPAGSLEATLSQIWCDLLGLEAVGLEDSFFDLGGHSLLLGKLRTRLRQELDREVAVVDFFRFPTITSLADFLRGDGVGGGSALRRRRRIAGSLEGDSSVAIVGLAGRFPGAADEAALWQLLTAGREGLRDLTDEELVAAGVSPAQAGEPDYVRRTGVLADFDTFDAAAFGFTAREAELLDPQHRVFLECAVDALDNAGLDPQTYGGAIGVYAGAGLNGYLVHQLAAAAGADTAAAYQVMIGNDKDFLATRLSYELDLSGPSLAVQTACSTSLVAVHLACRSLLAGEADAALAGGVSVAVPHTAGYRYQNGMILSPDGQCRPFAAEAAGTVRASGAGVVVLKRLADAEADGDRIRAVILGSAINNDGRRKIGYTAPSVDRQAEVIAEAQAIAGVAAETVTYVEAHGTGTELGDPIEIAALSQVFGDAREVALGSVKGNLGHLDAAAGVSGLIKTVLALEHGELPPNLHRGEVAEAVRESPFRPVAESTSWQRPDGGRRRAGVSSFGIGGTNAHLVVEEASDPSLAAPAEAGEEALPTAAQAEDDAVPQLVVLSAHDGQALDELGRDLAAHLRSDEAPPLAAVAHTLQTGRRRLAHRRVLVAGDGADAASALDPLDPARVLEARGDDGRGESGRREVVFLFPGQGAQRPAMGSQLYGDEPVFRQVVDRACDHYGTEFDLRAVLFASGEGGGEALRQTRWTQPALFVFETALAELWKSWGISPAAMLGHSLGEYVAAHRAGVFSFEAGLDLVRRRGELIQALPEGSMAAVSAPAETVAPTLPPSLTVAAINDQATCVVAGSGEALEGWIAGSGLRARPLVTSHAFHSPMMAPVEEPLKELFAALPLEAPKIPYVSNLTGTRITAEQATDPAYWAAHLRQPVRFADGLRQLAGDPRRVLLEVGPGETSLTFARRLGEGGTGFAPSALVPTLPVPALAKEEAASLRRALGRLWLGGVDIDWAGLWSQGAPTKVALPAYPWQRQRYWVEKTVSAVTIGGGAAPGEAAVDRLYVPSWKRSLAAAPVPQNGDPPPAHWRIVAPAELPLAAALVRELEARGVAVERVSHLDLGTADSVGDGVLVDLRPGAGAGAESFDHWMALGQALAADPSTVPRQVVAVTAGQLAVTGGETADPDGLALLGPLRVMAQEVPGLVSRHLDLEASAFVTEEAAVADWARTLAAELLDERGDRTVAVRGPYRWLPTFEELPQLADDDFRLRDGVYLVLGAFGTVGRALTSALVDLGAAELLLVGRTAGGTLSADRQEWLRGLEERGVKVHRESLDAADGAALGRLVAAWSERLRGVVEAAGAGGLASARALGEERPESWGRTFAERRALLTALDHALAGVELDFCLLSSSLAGELGGLGYAAYGAAHRWGDAFCERPSRPVPWTSIAWDNWRGPGAEGPEALDGERGGALLRRVLASRQTGRVLALVGDLATRYQRSVEQPAEARQPLVGGAAAQQRPDLQSPFVAPGDALEKALAEIWSRALGVAPVGIHDNFFELGGTSLVGIQTMAEVNQRFAAEVPAVGLYEGPTIHALAELLRAALPGAANGDPAPEAKLSAGQARGDRRRQAARRRSSRVPVGGEGR